MFQAILSKEFLKIKYIYFTLVILFIAVLLYLYISTLQNFTKIEPHSMLWYQAVHIGNIYYDVLKFLPSFAAFIIALAQFLPEIHKKKFRIPLHLPINQNKMVFLYLSVGLLLLVLVNSILLLCLYFISSVFYPSLIAVSAIQTALPWILASFVVYTFCVAIMIEPYFKRKFLLCILMIMIVSFFFLNDKYQGYNHLYTFLTVLLVLSLFMPLLSLYRFKNGHYSLLKEKSFIPKLSFLIFLVLFLTSFSFFLPYSTKALSKNIDLATYVFYSAPQKQFMYKQHLGYHHFVYGNDKNEKLSLKEYEKALPFIYWRNLDIQKKLPIVIDGISYDKKTIKKARQSFKFAYNNVNENINQIALYPLFNPSSKKGIISFPNLMFNLDQEFSIYDSEDNSKDVELSKQYTLALKNKGFSFPAKIIAGKTTNMKPLDEGYFVLDNKNKLFHFKRYDDELFIKNVSYDSKIKITQIKIAESRKKEFYGLIIDENNNAYVLMYKNYNFVKLPLKYYDSNTMKLEIYANAVNKLIRYKDEKYIYAVAFDKNFSYLDEFKVGIPQVSSLYQTFFDYAYTFNIKKNPYKSYEEYSFEIGAKKAFVLSFCLALLYLLLFRKEKKETRILKSILLLFTGLYGVLILAVL
ncbi:MAG: DUF4857 domain-containing protein [Campylobacteraceae bacterium]|nr:DUF4857 domain-containing protein [Campylobacteraceae bacterium]